MRSALRVRTPEGVVFDLTLAGPVARLLAWSVDAALIGAATLAATRLLAVLEAVSPDLAGAATTLAYFAISVGYGMGAEWFGRGQTVGKRVLGLRVIDEQGLRIRFHQIALRNLLRAVDLLPGLYLVGGAACLLSPRGQRLGDLAAGTVVVRPPRLAEPDLDQLLAGKFNSLRGHPHLEARLRQRTTPAEAALALEALLRREELESDARVRVFAAVAARLRSVVAFPEEATVGLTDEQYVRGCVDILFRTPPKTPRP